MITVFTPTYNRKHLLLRLYQSLVVQTNQDFEWLIVDDGSTDGTAELIRSFTQEKRIRICYLYCQNGGKHRAINKGVQLAKGELFFIVDSDDYLPCDALENIQMEWNELSSKEFYGGLCFRKVLDSTQQILGAPYPMFRFDSDSLEISRYNISADRAEVFQTDILKQYSFPEIENENFMPEALVWHRIAASNLKLRFVDRGIYICEYLEDGLSKNFKSNLKKNCKGFALYYQELLHYKQIPFYPYKVKALIRLWQCEIYKLIK